MDTATNSTIDIATNSTKPVFVDRAGRRRRLIVAAGAAGGVMLALALLALLAGFTGAGPRYLPWLPGPDTAQARNAAAAAATPEPSGTARFGPRAPQPTSGTTDVRPPARVPSPAGPPVAGPATTSPGLPVASTNTHRTVPTQTPTAHPSKKR
jgi:hypothetical protein